MTQRGMKEEQMVIVAELMFRVTELISQFNYQDDKELRKTQLKEFREFIKNNKELENIREEVKNLCSQFPIYS
jgi:glycine/serine hydroxymethyltransferase